MGTGRTKDSDNCSGASGDGSFSARARKLGIKRLKEEYNEFTPLELAIAMKNGSFNLEEDLSSYSQEEITFEISDGHQIEPLSAARLD